ncbi:MAG: class A beta-lactamase-related serine hydrolase [Gemmatimonadota bacterium]|nr:class A beta-lactamase-related serine hydrolase [Gemmatimonadota bacterium]
MITFIATLALGATFARTAPVTSTDSLSAQIQARIAQLPGAEVGVAYHKLGTGDSLYLNSDQSFHAASTMKVPIMIQLFRRVDTGGLSLDYPLLLVNEFGSIVDGSPYSLDETDDSDSAMYKRVGTRVTVRDLITHMITRSSNLATNSLVALANAAAAESTMRSLGAMKIRVLRGVEDQKAFDAGRNNTTTARDLSIILSAIEENKAASAKSCATMRDILLEQEFNTGIPSQLPAGTKVAHKTGWITGVTHDAALVYPQRGPAYALVVLTKGIPDEPTAQKLIGDISKLVYDHAMGPNISLHP